MFSGWGRVIMVEVHGFGFDSRFAVFGSCFGSVSMVRFKFWFVGFGSILVVQWVWVEFMFSFEQRVDGFDPSVGSVEVVVVDAIRVLVWWFHFGFWFDGLDDGGFETRFVGLF